MARARVSSSASSSSSSASSSGSPQPQPEAETNQAPAPSAAQSDLAPEGENFGPELPSALPSDAPEPSGSDSDSAPPDNKAVIPRTSAAGHILTGGYNTYKVYIGNLPPTATLEDLQDCFSQLGNCACQIKRGFGFVEYTSASSAAEAVAKYHEGHFLGAQIKVELSHARAPPHKDSGAPADGSAGGSGCYICGLDGHWAKDCPEAGTGKLPVRNPPGSDRPTDVRKPMHINGPPGGAVAGPSGLRQAAGGPPPLGGPGPYGAPPFGGDRYGPPPPGAYPPYGGPGGYYDFRAPPPGAYWPPDPRFAYPPPGAYGRPPYGAGYPYDPRGPPPGYPPYPMPSYGHPMVMGGYPYPPYGGRGSMSPPGVGYDPYAPPGGLWAGSERGGEEHGQRSAAEEEGRWPRGQAAGDERGGGGRYEPYARARGTKAGEDKKRPASPGRGASGVPGGAGGKEKGKAKGESRADKRAKK